MATPRISLIAAIGARTRALGANNALLWRIPEDLKRFKEMTLGHPIIMGRKTYESIGRPLPGRTNIVLSDVVFDAPPEVRVCSSLEGAFEAAAATGTDEVFVIGGGLVYAQTIGVADRLYLTLVYDDAPGDTYFPEYTHLPLRKTFHEEHVGGDVRFSFVTYDRCDTGSS